MTNEDAIKIISVNGWGYTDGELKEATQMAAGALEKRTPKPPEHRDVGTTSLFGEALCPICSSLVFGTEKFCSECGQALKWNESEVQDET